VHGWAINVGVTTIITTTIIVTIVVTIIITIIISVTVCGYYPHPNNLVDCLFAS
jgi:hypothetical protein